MSNKKKKNIPMVVYPHSNLCLAHVPNVFSHMLIHNHGQPKHEHTLSQIQEELQPLNLDLLDERKVA